jgi:hypothetical protein
MAWFCVRYGTVLFQWGWDVSEFRIANSPGKAILISPSLGRNRNCHDLNLHNKMCLMAGIWSCKTKAEQSLCSYWVLRRTDVCFMRLHSIGLLYWTACTQELLYIEMNTVKNRCEVLLIFIGYWSFTDYILV